MADRLIEVEDRASRHLGTSLALKTLGWMFVIWGCLVSIWIWMGEKAGSLLWLLCSVGAIVAGMIFVNIASRLQARAAKMIADLAGPSVVDIAANRTVRPEGKDLRTGT